MSTIPEAPIPTHPSPRLLGLELEFDSGGTELHIPERAPNGWSRKGDGSLSNGWEYVVGPPLCLTDIRPVVQRFSDAFLNTNLTRRGGYHVHVQSNAMDTRQVFHTVRIYSHFQPVIDTLVGESRVRNNYCQAYEAGITQRGLVEMFHLDSSAENRASAKGTRRYSVVNCAMMRCRREDDRSLEYRQGSPSKRFPCIFGWAALMLSITCMGADEQSIICAPTLEKFMGMLRTHESRSGATNIANWVQWRFDYLNREPDNDMMEKAKALFSTGKMHGLFAVSRKLDINLAVAKRVITGLIDSRFIRQKQHNGSDQRGTILYQAVAAHIVVNDFERLKAAHITRVLGLDERDPVSVDVLG